MVNIYELLNRIIVNKRYSLSPNLFIEADRTELSEEERSIFDLLKNIVSLRTKIHNDGIEFHPMFVMADDSRTFSIEDISEDDYFRYIQLNTSRINKIRSNSVVEYISERLLSLMAYIKLQCKLPHLADLLIKAHTLSYASILS